MNTFNKRYDYVDYFLLTLTGLVFKALKITVATFKRSAKIYKNVKLSYEKGFLLVNVKYLQTDFN